MAKRVLRAVIEFEIADVSPEQRRAFENSAKFPDVKLSGDLAGLQAKALTEMLEDLPMGGNIAQNISFVQTEDGSACVPIQCEKITVIKTTWLEQSD